MTTSTTIVNLAFDTTNLNLVNMQINYNNVAVATNDNAQLSITPLQPPSNNTYNIATPTITYIPKPRQVLDGSTVSNILINEDDAKLILSENIPSIDFEVSTSIQTLELNNDLTLSINQTSSTGAVSLLDNQFINYLSSIIPSSVNNDIAVYQIGSYLIIFVPISTTLTNIYISELLPNNYITEPVLTNISISVGIYSPYIGMYNEVIYIIGVNSNNDLVAYSIAYNDGSISNLTTISTTSFPTITNNLGINFNYANNIRNLFAINNGYIYILGSIGSDFEYAYAPINSDSTIGSWTIGSCLFGTSTSTYAGLSQTLVYNNNIYVSGLLINETFDYGGSTGKYNQSFNMFLITINTNGSLNTANSLNYPNSNYYYINTNMYIYNNNLCLFNIYTVNQIYSANDSGFTNPGPIYYTQLDINGNPTTWLESVSTISTMNNPYFVNAYGQFLAISTYSGVGVSSFTFNNNSLVLNPPIITFNGSSKLNYACNSTYYDISGIELFSVNGIYYNNNLYFYYIGSNELQIANINSNNQVSNITSSLNLPNSFIFTNGFIYNNNYYLINQYEATCNYVSISQNIVMYPLNKYGILESGITLEAPISGLASLANFSAIVLNDIVYIIGGNTITSPINGGIIYNSTSSSTVVYSAAINANGSLGTWSDSLNLSVPTVGFATNVLNINDEYLLAIGNDGKLYSSIITNNVPGTFSIIDSSLTYSANMYSLVYINGLLILGTFINSATSTLGIYYTTFSNNTITGWNTSITDIASKYTPSIFLGNNNCLIFFDLINEYYNVFYLNNSNFQYSLVPSTSFTSLPTNYYINNLSVKGLVGNIANSEVFSKLTLSSTSFTSGTYTLTYSTMNNSTDGLNIYLNINNIYNYDSISQIQLAVQGRQYTLPPIT